MPVIHRVICMEGLLRVLAEWKYFSNCWHFNSTFHRAVQDCRKGYTAHTGWTCSRSIEASGLMAPEIGGIFGGELQLGESGAKANGGGFRQRPKVTVSPLRRVDIL